MMNVERLAKEGKLPDGMTLTDFAPAHKRVGLACVWCKRFKKYDIEWKDKHEYYECHNTYPYDNAADGTVSTRPIRLHVNEVMAHGDRYCPTGWRYLNELHKPGLEWVNEPLPQDQVNAIIEASRRTSPDA
jgi:hypothetical protein